MELNRLKSNWFGVPSSPEVHCKLGGYINSRLCHKWFLFWRHGTHGFIPPPPPHHPWFWYLDDRMLTERAAISAFWNSSPVIKERFKPTFTLQIVPARRILTHSYVKWLLVGIVSNIRNRPVGLSYHCWLCNKFDTSYEGGFRYHVELDLTSHSSDISIYSISHVASTTW